jgi:replication factor C large subunit
MVDVELLPWPEKHRPVSMVHLVGNKEAFKVLTDWVESWKRGVPHRRAVLLVGPPGIGKTASVGALVHDLDVEVVEFNASDKRNKAHIENQVWLAATQQTLDGRMRIILLDEVDGLSGTSDRGGAGAIAKVLNQAVHPVIMTANDPKSSRLKDMIKVCKVITFDLPTYEDVVEVLQRIASAEGAEIEADMLDEIAERSGGDIRAAVSDLETLAKGGIMDALDSILTRDVKRSAVETLKRLFGTTDAKTARRVTSDADINHDQLILWLEENVHLHLTTPDELNRGLEAIALADLSLGRIMRGQNWKILSYVYDFLSVGVATSRTESPFRQVEYSEPLWPLLVWQGNRKRDKMKQILSRISGMTGVSRDRVLRTHYDTVIEIIQRSPKTKDGFAEWLKVSKGALDQRSGRTGRRG